jgi:hypothetical protein
VNDIHWMAARINATSPSELTVVMYIIYTNLNPRQQNGTGFNRVPIPPSSMNNNTNARMSNSLKSSASNNQIRERASTILLPPMKANLIVTVRSSSVGSEQTIGNNIPPERNVEFFR